MIIVLLRHILKLFFYYWHCCIMPQWVMMQWCGNLCVYMHLLARPAHLHSMQSRDYETFQRQSVCPVDRQRLVAGLLLSAVWAWEWRVPAASSNGATAQFQQQMRAVSRWQRREHSLVCSLHTHTRLTALCPGLPGWAGTRKVKLIWILLKQETVSDSGISWAVCKFCTSLQTDNHTNTPPLSFLQAGCPSCRPTYSVKALKVCSLHNRAYMIWWHRALTTVTYSSACTVQDLLICCFCQTGPSSLNCMYLPAYLLHDSIHAIIVLVIKSSYLLFNVSQ